MPSLNSTQVADSRTTRHRIAQWKSIHHVCERSRGWSPVLSLSKFMFKTCQLPPSNHPLLWLVSKIMVWCHISLHMMCTAGLVTSYSWFIMAEGQAYLVWPLGKVKCFDTLHPSLEWNVWCRHSIVHKWQTLEAARHRIAQWTSIHHVCERSRVDPRYCLFWNLCSKLVNCHHLTTPSYN